VHADRRRPAYAAADAGADADAADARVLAVRVRRLERSAKTLAEQREAIDRLVAEHEPDVARSDALAPRFGHRRRGDPVLEETPRELARPEPAGVCVEERRPAAVCGHQRQALALTCERVVPPFPFGDRGANVVVAGADRRGCSDLAEAARDD